MSYKSMYYLSLSLIIFFIYFKILQKIWTTYMRFVCIFNVGDYDVAKEYYVPQ